MEGPYETGIRHPKQLEILWAGRAPCFTGDSKEGGQDLRARGGFMYRALGSEELLGWWSLLTVIPRGLSNCLCLNCRVGDSSWLSWRLLCSESLWEELEGPSIRKSPVLWCGTPVSSAWRSCEPCRCWQTALLLQMLLGLDGRKGAELNASPILAARRCCAASKIAGETTVAQRGLWPCKEGSGDGGGNPLYCSTESLPVAFITFFVDVYSDLEPGLPAIPVTAVLVVRWLFYQRVSLCADAA
ncbi:uncharacterized protein WM294_013573 [Sarcoramphus papa]